MPGMSQIPWDEYLETYNRIHSAKFKTPQDMIAALYEREGTLGKVGDIMGVSGNTINIFMTKYGLPRKPRGHRGNSKYQKRFKAINSPQQYTQEELAELIGCSRG
ncbi:MAG: hypothetical protein U9Q17_01550, partial [Chloroflexota bacterium]|nr:hypothetical protein [Chloroflexota bacterium]